MPQNDFWAEIRKYDHLTKSPLVWEFNIAPLLYSLSAAKGYCYGMSSASVVYWDTPSVKPVAVDTFVMTPSQAEEHIRELQVRNLIVATNIVGRRPLDPQFKAHPMLITVFASGCQKIQPDQRFLLDGLQILADTVW